jgi:hypothetical protein
MLRPPYLMKNTISRNDLTRESIAIMNALVFTQSCTAVNSKERLHPYTVCDYHNLRFGSVDQPRQETIHASVNVREILTPIFFPIVVVFGHAFGELDLWPYTLDAKNEQKRATSVKQPDESGQRCQISLTYF